MNITEKIDNYLNEATQLEVLTDEDFDELDPKAKKQWKGYGFKMTYDIVDAESAEIGDFKETGWKHKKSPENFDSLEELINYGDIRYESWLEWSGSPPNSKHDWIISQSDENYSTGEHTTYNLWIERNDRKPLSKTEMRFIHKELGLMGRI